MTPEVYRMGRITMKFGNTLENLEMLWFLRDQAERRLSAHLSGQELDPDEWAAVNTPDEAWDVSNPHRPPAEWLVFKNKWMAEGTELANLVKISHRNIRIATGHEPVKNLVCRP